MSDSTNKTADMVDLGSKLFVSLSKSCTFLAIAYAFVQVAITVPLVSRLLEEQASLNRLQLVQIEQIVHQTEGLSSAINDASLIYAARLAGSQKMIPNRNADEIVDTATERLTKQFGKDWGIVIKGFVAKLDELGL